MSPAGLLFDPEVLSTGMLGKVHSVLCGGNGVQLATLQSSYQSYAKEYYLMCTGLDKVVVHQNISLLYINNKPTSGNNE